MLPEEVLYDAITLSELWTAVVWEYFKFNFFKNKYDEAWLFSFVIIIGSCPPLKKQLFSEIYKCHKICSIYIGAVVERL
jgi:hypothetical protein